MRSICSAVATTLGGLLKRPDETPDSPHRQHSKPRAGTFRPDIEGLRAVAIVAVLLYHADLPFVSGGYVGVDVFFVISGFLITGALVREVERTGSLAVGRFWLRRVRRLLPAAAVTLVSVAGLSWLLLSPIRQGMVAGDLLAAGVYALNWRLASQAVDYLQGGGDPSPIQHFWSLAIEEQFYIVWPLLLLAAVWGIRRAGWSLRPTLRLLVGMVALSSLAYCVALTRQEANVAYFSTFARGWELALGGAVVFVAPRLRRPAAIALAGAGAGAIGWSAVQLDDGSLFPGLNALLPTLGTAAVLIAGAATPLRVLTLAPVRHIGRVSYSWYLWHWPVLIFAAAWLGELTLWQRLLAVTAAWVPSVLSYRWVEQPFREGATFVRSRRMTVGLGTACTTAVVAAGLVLPLTVQPVATKAMSEVRGAEAIQHGGSLQESADGLRPSPRLAKEDWPRTYRDGCHADRLSTASGACVYGDPSSDTTVVLFGDSHALQYFPALETLANRWGWRLVALTKSGCPPPETTLYNTALKREYTECDAWRENSLRRIVDKERPELVVASGRATYSVLEGGKRLEGQASSDALKQGYVATLEKLRDADIPAAVIGDNPHPDKDIPNCVSKHPDRLRDCAIPEEEARPFAKVALEAAGQVDGAHPVDPAPVLCRDEEDVCPAVIGDVIVYGQTTHLTATYVKTMTSWLEQQLPTDELTAKSS